MNGSGHWVDLGIIIGPELGRWTVGDPSSTGGMLAKVVEQRANVVDSHHLPYKWGGGHAGKTSVHQAVPVDCSGAVSEVLGIDPRVASQFKTFGSPGDGGNRGITVYAKDTHVFLKVNGHYFGTSTSNPGG